MLHDRTVMTAEKENITPENLARWHDHQATLAMSSLNCGSENWEYKNAGRKHDLHSAAAKLIRELAGAATLAGME